MKEKVATYLKMAHGAMGADTSDTMLDTFLRQFAEKHKEEGEWALKYGTDFDSDKIVMKRFCWCEKETCPYCFDLEAGKVTQELKEKYGMEDNKTAPNFWYKPLDFKVWWYKYIGRSVEVNKQLSDDDFKKMVDDCMSSVVLKMPDNVLHNTSKVMNYIGFVRC